MLLPQPNVKTFLLKTIGDSLSLTENANEENNNFEDMLEDLYDRLQKKPSQGHNW